MSLNPGCSTLACVSQASRFDAKGSIFLCEVDVSIALASAALAASSSLPAATPEKLVSIVLVHGGFVDGSGWQGVHNQLTKDGYEVIVVQNPTTSLADDVAVTKRSY